MRCGDWARRPGPHWFIDSPTHAFGKTCCYHGAGSWLKDAGYGMGGSGVCCQFGGACAWGSRGERSERDLCAGGHGAQHVEVWHVPCCSGWQMSVQRGAGRSVGQWLAGWLMASNGLCCKQPESNAMLASRCRMSAFCLHLEWLHWPRSHPLAWLGWGSSLLPG